MKDAEDETDHPGHSQEQSRKHPVGIQRVFRIPEGPGSDQKEKACERPQELLAGICHGC